MRIQKGSAFVIIGPYLVPMKPTTSQPATPAVSAVAATPLAPVGTPQTAPVRQTFMQRLNWFGGRVLDVAESIGEGVVSLLGLDDSLFQDVLDNMTEEEMAAAIEVNEERNEEYRRAGIIPEATLPDDLTVEDIGVDLYSTTGPQNYRKINNGMSNGDIENGGLEMKPTVSISRPQSEFEEMEGTPLTNTLTMEDSNKGANTASLKDKEQGQVEDISPVDTSAV